jgi:outer membrane protein assembly factor BamA
MTAAVQRKAVVLVLTALGMALAAPARAQSPTTETLGEVRVHGNHTTPDADVLRLADLTVGAPVTDDSLAQARERLRASGRFAAVEVRKRFRSLDNPADVLVIVLVDEHAAVSDIDLTPGPLKRIGSSGMWLPIVDYADGYGFTYGARVSFVDGFGPRSRVSVPLTWGGERKAGLEVDRGFQRGPFSRIEGTLSIARRENPHYDIAETRRTAGARAERRVADWLRVGGGARLTSVSFGGVDERHIAPGIDAIVDTRTDPAYPRNAVHAALGVEQLRFSGGRHIARRTSDLRGYVGLVRSTVLALRVTTSHAGDPLPAYERALLGGTSTLRGYDFGYRSGDNLTAASAEIRVPITSPLHMSRLGLKAFVDAGTVYDAGARLSEQRFDRGVGGGVFFTATVVRAGLDVAWPQTGEGARKPRWHFGLGVTF